MQLFTTKPAWCIFYNFFFSSLKLGLPKFTIKLRKCEIFSMTEFAYFQPKHTIYFQCSINLSTRFVLIDECAYVLRLNAFSFHFILFRWFRLISDLIAFCILKPFVHNGKNISFRAHYDGSRSWYEARVLMVFVWQRNRKESSNYQIYKFPINATRLPLVHF